MLKQYRDAAKAEPGATTRPAVSGGRRAVSLREHGSVAGHGGLSGPRQGGVDDGLAERMKAVEYGPPDMRPHAVHFATPEGKAAGAGSVTIISHLDVPPMGIPALLELMKPFSEAVSKQPGMVTYRVLRQTAGRAEPLPQLRGVGERKGLGSAQSRQALAGLPQRHGAASGHAL